MIERSKLWKHAYGAEKIFLDAPIQMGSIAVSEVTSTTDAWHVDLLQYDQLNPQYDGKGVVVAVLDTGVDYTHPALNDKMWHNPKEIPNNGIDDDGNGFVDDYFGYDFSTANRSSVMDTSGHGTHCAGLIAANKDPNSNAQGIAPGAQIMALKIGNNEAGFLTAVARAIHYAVDNGAKILSNSWYLYQDSPNGNNTEGLKMLADAIHYAEAHGVIFVNIAGNEHNNLDLWLDPKELAYNPIFPMALGPFKNYISVGSSSLEEGIETLSYFSNYGKQHVDVVAPGEKIHSTYLVKDWVDLSGTSMAGPIVAGALARGISRGYTWEQAIVHLKETSVVNDYWHQYTIYGRIDIKKYLQ